MSRWDPWRGCHRCSEGCRFCYIHKGDAKRGINTNDIVRSDKFNRPIEKKKNGEYKMAAGLVYLCFSSDFLLEDADEWRSEAWKIIKERSDCTFLFLTKRIERSISVFPMTGETAMIMLWSAARLRIRRRPIVSCQSFSNFQLNINRLPLSH